MWIQLTHWGYKHIITGKIVNLELVFKVKVRQKESLNSQGSLTIQVC